MDTIMHFQNNASVCAFDSEEIGHLSRVVLRPDTNVVTHIVVRMKSLLKKEERVVPIEMISDAFGNLITLNKSIEEMEVFPLFEEKHFIPKDESVDMSPPTFQPMMTGVPQPTPVITRSPSEKYTTIVEQNIPEGTIAVKEGAKVLTADGKVVGKVESLVSDAPDDYQVTHLLVSKGLITGERRLVPINWVEQLGEEKIQLNVEESSVQELENISAE